MFPPNFIVVERIGLDLEIHSKKRLLEVLGQYLATAVPSATREEIFGRLLDRERLGSTGLGLGIALPHARLRRADQPVGAFVRLSKGIDFDAIDDQPIDLAFALLVPEAATEAHLQLLTKLAGLSLGRPLVLAGGSSRITPGGVPEADAMANAAVMLGYPRKDLILDSRSRNSWENAEAVKHVLQGRTVILVTSAYHMTRSAGMFRKQGFTVIPDPAGYHEQTQQFAPAHLLPKADALALSSAALSEYISLAWYRATGKL